MEGNLVLIGLKLCDMYLRDRKYVLCFYFNIIVNVVIGLVIGLVWGFNIISY